jgi:uncharacterized membrane protein
MRLGTLGFILLIAGVIIAFVSTLIPFIAGLLSGFGGGEVKVTGGGCVVVFFIPICFGYGDPLILILLMAVAIVLVVVSFIIFKSLVKTTHSLGERFT